MATSGSNKAKIAKRVIEVLEFFDEAHPRATVMDIVRRFDRPQSSTSELLSSLVEVGLLYKDPYSRSYSPTPRAAILGCAAQPGLVRNGRLTEVTDRLCVQTGLGVALFGMVGLEVQVYNWRIGQRPLRLSHADSICGGQKDRLTDSAAGQLLLSTIPQPRRDGMVRRLNAEAPADRKFCFSEMAAVIQHCHDARGATGPAGFRSGAEVSAVLLPDMPDNQPMAIGFVYDPSDQIDTSALRATLQDAVVRCVAGENGIATVQPLFDVGEAATRSPIPRLTNGAATWSNGQTMLPRVQPHR